MSGTSYTFLPWMRQGLAGQISAADGDTTVTARATVPVDLELRAPEVVGAAVGAEPISRAIELYGPGDVVGIDPRAVIRTEPRDWITDVEPNFLAHIEFADEDLPWRYTPAAPSASGLQLRPWIALIVLEENEDAPEFRDLGVSVGGPLPAIEVLDPAALPPAAELWAWAHVHVNASLAANPTEFVTSDTTAVAGRLQSALASNRDVAYSRLVCPRRLHADRRYHAFVVPTFESGRLAGLGLDPADAPHATASSWATSATLPYYYRWYFRTGGAGDFEFLVRLLEARTMDAKVGIRDVDVREPGSNVRGYADLGGILKLGGALRVPDSALDADQLAERARFEDWDQQPPAPQPYPQPLQRDLAAFVNLPDDYAVHPAEDANTDSGLGEAVEGDPDPLITAPLYGRWHARTTRLLADRAGAPLDPDDNWVHELNLDPRHRLASGFGTRVIQDNQEKYMDAAWGQIGDVLEANRRIRLAELAKLVSQGLWSSQFQLAATTQPERLLRLTASAHRHVLLADTAFEKSATAGSPDASPSAATGATAVAAPATPAPASTVRHRLTTSLAGPTLVSAAFRRTLRPGGRLAKRLPWSDGITRDSLLGRVDAGVVAAAPPVTTPPALVTTDKFADALPVAGLPGWLPKWLRDWLIALLRKHPSLPWLMLGIGVALLVVAAILFIVGGAVALWIAVIALVLAAAAGGLFVAFRRVLAGIEMNDSLRPSGLTVAAVDALPPAPGFELAEPGETRPPLGESGGDSPTAARFKDALRDWHLVHQATVASGRVPARTRFGRGGIQALAEGMFAAIEPARTVPRRIHSGLTLPPRIVADLVEDFGEVMAYPRIDQPMYEPLRDRSAELLLPNLNLIPPNTISLLETNQPFIEAYMVGVNHEMARELLWREYPTDQRGTPFRQFWDVSGALPEPGLSEEKAKESLYDIPELHRWPRRSQLGEHDNREKVPGSEEAELVLVIRGELLKKYPDTIIYAHKAVWDSPNGSPAPAKERLLADLTEAQEADPPPNLVLMPLYEARVSPDITFFGFDLTEEVAKGSPEGDAGWFFCLKERPGELRFGFDLTGETGIETVNDIAWPHLGTAEGGFIAANTLSTIALDPLDPNDSEKLEQRGDDVKAIVAPVSSARWAYLAYQSPVLVAVHAAEMLQPKESSS